MLVDFFTDMVYVKFDACSKQYAFKLPKSLQPGENTDHVEVGDKVVVRTTNNQLVVCTVSGLNATIPEEYQERIEYIICKIDFTEELHRKEIAKKRERLMNELGARRKRYEEKAIFNLIAEKDPEAKKLLDALNALESGDTE